MFRGFIALVEAAKTALPVKNSSSGCSGLRGPSAALSETSQPSHQNQWWSQFKFAKTQGPHAGFWVMLDGLLLGRKMSLRIFTPEPPGP